MGRRSSTPPNSRAARRRRAALPWARDVVILAIVAALAAGAVLWLPPLYEALTVNRLPKQTARLTTDQAAPPLEPDAPPSSPGAGPCTRLNVLASPENEAAVRAVAAVYHGAQRNAGGRCVDVAVTARKSGLAADDAARGFAGLPPDQRPALWIPDSSAWPSVARGAGEQGAAIVPESGAGIAMTAIALAMPADMAAARGWDAAPPTWADVYKAASDARGWERAGHPEWGYFKLAKGSPAMSSAGLFALASAYGSAAGHLDRLTTSDLGSDFVASQVRLGELATSSYVASPGHFLHSVRDAADVTAVSGKLSAMIADERSVWEYNRGVTSLDGMSAANGAPPTVPLTPYYPADGVYTSESPALVLNAAWVGDAQRAGADDFVRFARTAQGQAAVRAAGYRDIRSEADPEVAAAGRYGTATKVLGPLPSELAAGLQKGFAAVRKPARVLFTLDVSGSMRDEAAPGVTKIEAAKDAVEGSLGLFGYEDQVGVAGFSNWDGGPLVPGVVQPLASVKSMRERITAKIRGLEPMYYTPLYEAVGLAVDTVSEGYRPDALNAVILLSDGTNDTTRKGTLEEAIARLEQGQAAGRKVKVFTLAYGDQADTDALRRIAAASGGQFFDATDPSRIKDVFKDLASSL
ncbi:vWA domain-containing protein [Sinomonas mesophila]|uniref:vWA domain-containing protein n=1 Tax=Sinomonas mesophila TaxID=1531955 RepID=UPI0009869E07|nr:VWA domain-containing protein [Sinomonas mesophila]